MEANDHVTVMTTEETIAFLRERRFGRLAMILGNEPHIVPVNYAWSTEYHRPGILYIRSAPGEKLLSAAMEHTVVFEVDDIREAGAVSAIVRGTSRIVTDRGELTHVESLNLRPWVATRKTDYIAIEVTELSGRQFDFGDETEAPLEP